MAFTSSFNLQFRGNSRKRTFTTNQNSHFTFSSNHFGSNASGANSYPVQLMEVDDDRSYRGRTLDFFLLVALFTISGAATEDVTMAYEDESEDVDMDSPFPFAWSCHSIHTVSMEDVQSDFGDMDVDFDTPSGLPDSRSPPLSGGWPISTFMPSLISYVDEDEDQETIPYSWSCEDIYELPWERNPILSQDQYDFFEESSRSSCTLFTPQPIYPRDQIPFLDCDPCNFFENTDLGKLEECNLDIAPSVPLLTKHMSLLDIKDVSDVSLAFKIAESNSNATDTTDGLNAAPVHLDDDSSIKTQSPRLFSFTKPFEFTYLSAFYERPLYKNLLENLNRKPRYEIPDIKGWVPQRSGEVDLKLKGKTEEANLIESPSCEKSHTPEPAGARDIVYHTNEELTPLPIRTIRTNPNQDPFSMFCSFLLSNSCEIYSIALDMTPVSSSETRKTENAPGAAQVRYKQLISDSAFKDLSSHLPSPPPSPTPSCNASKLELKIAHKPVQILCKETSTTRQTTRMDTCDPGCIKPKSAQNTQLSILFEKFSPVRQPTRTPVHDSLPSPCETPTPKRHLLPEALHSNLPETTKPKKDPVPKLNEGGCKPEIPTEKYDEECTFPGTYPLDELESLWISKWANKILVSPPPSFAQWAVYQIFGW